MTRVPFRAARSCRRVPSQHSWPRALQDTIPARWRRCRARLRRRTGDFGLAGDARRFFAGGRSEEVLSRGRVGGTVLHAGSPADLVPGAERLLALHRLRHLLSQDLRQTRRSWRPAVLQPGGYCVGSHGHAGREDLYQVRRRSAACCLGVSAGRRGTVARECGARDPSPQVGCALRRGARRSVLWTDWLSRRAQHLASGACSRGSAYLLGLSKATPVLARGRLTPGLPMHLLVRRELG